MEEQNGNILEKIHASYYQLTVSERKAADYVISHTAQVQFMSITQLADECGVAEATISRFCRSLKLKGFNAFKIELAKHTASVAAAAALPKEAKSDTQKGRIANVGRLAVEAVNQTLDLVEPRKVIHAVELLEKASHVICIGSGGSMILADECAHLFSTVTGKFYAISDSHNQMAATATLSQEDVIILFSYSGATTNSIEVLELAKERGIATILITRFPQSPAAKLAKVVLRCGSNEGPFQFGSVPAKIAQLITVDVVFQEYCHRNLESCQENIQRIAAALSVKHI